MQSITRHESSPRFQNKHPCPVMPTPLPQLFTPGNLSDPEAIVINLCHSQNWQTMLMGGWRLSQGKLWFEIGELPPALAIRCKIIIQNPPKNEAFELFWHLARVRKKFTTRELSIPYPDHLILSQYEGYDWSHAQTQCTNTTPSNNKRLILNPTCLTYFLTQYSIDIDEHFNQMPGLIEQQAQTASPLPLAVDVTR